MGRPAWFDLGAPAAKGIEAPAPVPSADGPGYPAPARRTRGEVLSRRQRLHATWQSREPSVTRIRGSERHSRNRRLRTTTVDFLAIGRTSVRAATKRMGSSVPPSPPGATATTLCVCSRRCPSNPAVAPCPCARRREAGRAPFERDRSPSDGTGAVSAGPAGTPTRTPGTFRAASRRRPRLWLEQPRPLHRWRAGMRE